MTPIADLDDDALIAAYGAANPDSPESEVLGEEIDERGLGV